MNRNNPTAGLLERARIAHHAGRLDEARAHYRDILASEPANGEVLYALAILAQQMGRPDVAVKRLREAVSHQPAQIALGNGYLALGEPQRAARHYRAALRIDPGHAGSHLNLGNLLQHAGRIDQAARHFEQAIAPDPELAEAHNSLGLLRQRQGRLEAASSHYRRAIALRPRYAAAYNNLGTTCRELGRFDQAIGHYEAALRLEPNLQTQANLAAMLERTNKPDVARRAAEKALALDPDHAKSRLILAKVKARLGERTGARRDYEALVAVLGEPRGPGQTLNAARARLCEQAGDFDRAMALYREANWLNCEIAPDWQVDAAD